MTAMPGIHPKKALEGVFDKKTLLALQGMINQGIIESIAGPISTGKEANVYQGMAAGKVAIKLYRVESSNYKKMALYLRSDQRFAHIKHDLKSTIYAFAQKEYRNLQRAFSAGVHCPRPIACKNNILVMDFIGDESPAPRIKTAEFDETLGLQLYSSVLQDLTLLYQKAELVHADASEYNTLLRLSDLTPFLIDFSQAVLKTHPQANEYLRRDIRNITKFFRKKGVETPPEKDAFQDIISIK